MNKARGTLIVVVIAFAGLTCAAQQAAIPFAQIARNTQLTASLSLPGNDSAAISSSSSLSPGVVLEEPAMAGFVRVPPVSVRWALPKSYFLLNGLHLGMAVLDVGLTQHCIATHRCAEGNPIMPSSMAGQLGVGFAFVGYGSWVSHRLMKRGSHMWWISPAAGTATHIVGVASGLAHW